MYIVGCDDIDFSNPDSPIWIFEMSQWRNNVIPKNTTDIYDKKSNKQIHMIKEYENNINTTQRFDRFTLERI